MPRLVVCLPVYNATSFLAQTIDSLEAQSFRDFVVIAIDDNSCDGSFDYIKSLTSSSRLRYVILQNEENLGIAGTWNKCIATQRMMFPYAEYLMKMDHDDILSPYVLEASVRELDSDPTLVLSYCYVEFFGITQDISDIIGQHLVQKGFCRNENWTMKGKDILRFMIRFDNFITTCTGTVFRKVALEQLKPPQINGSFLWANDFDLWFRLSFWGNFRYLATSSIHYRVHSENYTAKIASFEKINEVMNIQTRALMEGLRHYGFWWGVDLIPVMVYKWIRFWISHIRVPHNTK